MANLHTENSAVKRLPCRKTAPVSGVPASGQSKSPAVFIDRDGTIIHERNYLRLVKDIRIFPFAIEALALLRSAGFKLVLITNQSGIGRGYFTEKKLHQIHHSLQKQLARKKVAFDGVYYCPHHPEANCDCRKPRLGLVKQAARDLHLSLKHSFTIGDHVNDFRLGQNMGGKGIFVLTGHGHEEHKKIRSRKEELRPDAVLKNVLEAARWIIKETTTDPAYQSHTGNRTTRGVETK